MSCPENCQRCGGSLLVGTSKTWKMSWFTEEELCTKCQDAEDEIKHQLYIDGVEVCKLEGCGKVPIMSNSGKFIVED